MKMSLLENDTLRMHYLDQGLNEGPWGGQDACPGPLLPLHLTGWTHWQSIIDKRNFFEKRIVPNFLFSGHPSWPDPFCATCAREERGEKIIKNIILLFCHLHCQYIHFNQYHQYHMYVSPVRAISPLTSKAKYTVPPVWLNLPGCNTTMHIVSSKVTYKEQAKFSISSYPFSMKLLWAPLVDSLYVARSDTWQKSL